MDAPTLMSSMLFSSLTFFICIVITVVIYQFLTCTFSTRYFCGDSDKREGSSSSPPLVWPIGVPTDEPPPDSLTEEEQRQLVRQQLQTQCWTDCLKETEKERNDANSSQSINTNLKEIVTPPYQKREGVVPVWLWDQSVWDYDTVCPDGYGECPLDESYYASGVEFHPDSGLSDVDRTTWEETVRSQKDFWYPEDKEKQQILRSFYNKYGCCKKLSNGKAAVTFRAAVNKAPPKNPEDSAALQYYGKFAPRGVSFSEQNNRWVDNGLKKMTGYTLLGNPSVNFNDFNEHNIGGGQIPKYPFSTKWSGTNEEHNNKIFGAVDWNTDHTLNAVGKYEKASKTWTDPSDHIGGSYSLKNLWGGDLTGDDMCHLVVNKNGIVDGCSTPIFAEDLGNSKYGKRWTNKDWVVGYSPAYNEESTEGYANFKDPTCLLGAIGADRHEQLSKKETQTKCSTKCSIGVAGIDMPPSLKKWIWLQDPAKEKDRPNHVSCSLKSYKNLWKDRTEGGFYDIGILQMNTDELIPTK